MKPIIPFVILIVTFFSFSCSNPITTDDTQAKIDTVLKTVAKMESEAMASRLEKANENDSSIQEDNQAEKINTYLVESLKSAFGDQYKEKIRGYSLDYSRFLPNDSKRKQVFIDNTGTKVIPIAWYCTFEDWDVYVWAVVTWGKGTYSADGGSRNYVKVRVVYNYCDFFPSETSAGLYGAGDYFLDEVNAYICDETNTANPTFIQNKNTCLAYAKAGLFPYDQSRNVTSAWISMKDNGFNSIFWTRITDINTSYKYSVANDPAPSLGFLLACGSTIGDVYSSDASSPLVWHDTGSRGFIDVSITPSGKAWGIKRDNNGTGYIYYSTDHGITWKNTGAHGFSTIDANDSQVFAVGSSIGDVYRANQDSPQSWTDTGARGFIDISLTPSGRVWGVKNDNGKIYYSDDFGKTWVDTTASGFTSIDANNSYVYAVGKSIGDLFRATFCSPSSWVDTGAKGFLGVTISESNRVYASSSTLGGIVYSDNNGISWINTMAHGFQMIDTN